MARKTTCILMCAAVAALVLGVFPTTTLAQKGSRALDVLVPTTDAPGLPRLNRDTEPCENPSPPPPTLNVQLLDLDLPPGLEHHFTQNGNHYCLTLDVTVNPVVFQLEVDVSGLDPGGPDEELIRAGQFFLNYENAACTPGLVVCRFDGIETGEPGPAGNPDQSPFQQEIVEWHTPPAGGNPGVLGYSVGIPFGQPMSACDNALATIYFTPVRQGRLALWFRDPTILPTSMLSDDYGHSIISPPLVLDPLVGDMMEIIVDWTAPVLVGCPTELDITVECDAVPTAPTVTATDNCDPDPEVIYEEVRTDGPCADTYTLTRTWIARDWCGNESDPVVQIIHVQDTTDPVLAGCPTELDITVECDAVPTAPTVTATDNCDPDPEVIYEEVRTDGPCADTYTLTRTWIARDWCGNESDPVVQIIHVQDTTPPERDNCQDLVLDPYYVDPGDPCETVSVNYDPNDEVELVCGAWDNCDPDPDLACARDDGLNCFDDPYPCGVTTLTWTATDACGNSASWTTTVTVNAYTEVLVEVQLQAVYTDVTRAIEFELFTCDVNASTCGQSDPYVVCEEIVFTSSGVPNSAIGSATLTVPCGQYDCITARDPLHTLRRTLTPIPDNGTTYVAAFTAANGKDLIGGNLDGNDWVDIVDYGLFAGQWNTFPSANTACPAAYPPAHADFSGNARVWTEDYTFIQLHMWWESELNCCGLPFSGGSDGPIEAISVQELRDNGMSEAAAGDLNGDGWLDVQDLEEWARGTRPQPPTPNQKKDGISPQRP